MHFVSRFKTDDKQYIVYADEYKAKPRNIFLHLDLTPQKPTKTLNNTSVVIIVMLRFRCRFVNRKRRI